MSSFRPASSPNPVGLWFCQISSGLQARRQSGGGVSDPQGAKNDADTRQATAPADAAGTKGISVPVQPRRTAAPTTCRREAMPEVTVYLLLDRFAPS
jgi:hypothetical protein